MAQKRCVSCKIGTMPMLVVVDGRTPLAVGRRVRIRICDGATYNPHVEWQQVIVTKINEGGYFFADRC